MKNLEIDLLNGVNGIPFGAEREIVRKEFGKRYKEIKKTILSKNTMDAYDDYHIYYSEEGKFEAIEVFGKVKVIVDGKQIFPGKVSDAESILGSGNRDSEGIVFKRTSVGITFDLENESKIEAILFGCKGYYE